MSEITEDSQDTTENNAPEESVPPPLIKVKRKLWKWVLPIVCPIVLLNIAFPYLIDPLFQNKLHTISENSEPLIDALEQYHQTTGEYPESLDILIPKYLQEIPHSGVTMYPSYTYSPREGYKNKISSYYLYSSIPLPGWDEFLYGPYIYDNYGASHGRWMYYED